MNTLDAERFWMVKKLAKRSKRGRKPMKAEAKKRSYGTKLSPEVVEFLGQTPKAAAFIDARVRSSKEFRDWQKKRKQ
jgi:hypothetical protein